LWQDAPTDIDTPDGEDETPPIDVDRTSKMSITKVADQTRVKAGEETTFTVTITNEGPSVMESGRVITLKERPGTGVSIRGYAIVSGAAALSGGGNDAALPTHAAVLLCEAAWHEVPAPGGGLRLQQPTTVMRGH